jgi:hypothetical protein
MHELPTGHIEIPQGNSPLGAHPQKVSLSHHGMGFSEVQHPKRSPAGHRSQVPSTQNGVADVHSLLRQQASTGTQKPPQSRWPGGQPTHRRLSGLQLSPSEQSVSVQH